jgi:hypothetical protein
MPIEICLDPDFVSSIFQKETPYLGLEPLEPPSGTVKTLFTSKCCTCFERESDADRERETQTHIQTQTQRGTD